MILWFVIWICYIHHGCTSTSEVHAVCVWFKAFRQSHTREMLQSITSSHYQKLQCTPRYRNTTNYYSAPPSTFPSYNVLYSVPQWNNKALRKFAKYWSGTRPYYKIWTCCSLRPASLRWGARRSDSQSDTKRCMCDHTPTQPGTTAATTTTTTTTTRTHMPKHWHERVKSPLRKTSSYRLNGKALKMKKKPREKDMSSTDLNDLYQRCRNLC